MCDALHSAYQHSWCKLKRKPTFLSIPKTGSRVLMVFLSAHVAELHELPGRTDHSTCPQFAHPLPVECMYSSNHKVVTMIRSPLSRTVSEHAFHHQMMKQKNCSKLTWASFWPTRNNYQLGYVVGKRHHVDREDLGAVTKFMAQGKLIVGVFEEYTASLHHIMRHLNLPAPSRDSIQKAYVENRKFHPSGCNLPTHPLLPANYNALDSEWYALSVAQMSVQK